LCTEQVPAPIVRNKSLFATIDSTDWGTSH